MRWYFTFLSEIFVYVSVSVQDMNYIINTFSIVFFKIINLLPIQITLPHMYICCAMLCSHIHIYFLPYVHILIWYLRLEIQTTQPPEELLFGETAFQEIYKHKRL